MDVVVWLRSLGLGKYEAIFRDNDIDETVLPSLTHENLKELGVASFGHRVKLLDAHSTRSLRQQMASNERRCPDGERVGTPQSASTPPKQRTVYAPRLNPNRNILSPGRYRRMIAA